MGHQMMRKSETKDNSIKRLAALYLIAIVGCAKDYSGEFANISSDVQKISDRVSDIRSQVVDSEKQFEQQNAELATLLKRIKATEDENNKLTQKIEKMQIAVGAATAAILAIQKSSVEEKPVEPNDGTISLFDVEVPGNRVIFILDDSFGLSSQDERVLINSPYKQMLEQIAKTRSQGHLDSGIAEFREALSGILNSVEKLDDRQAFQVIYFGKDGVETLEPVNKWLNKTQGDREAVMGIADKASRRSLSGRDLRFAIRKAMFLKPDVIFVLSQFHFELGVETAKDLLDMVGNSAQIHLTMVASHGDERGSAKSAKMIGGTFQKRSIPDVGLQNPRK